MADPMKTLVYTLTLALCLWIDAGGCLPKEKADRSDNIDAFADLFFDLAQATQQCSGDTTALHQEHEALLQAYHISPAEVEQALNVYTQHPEKWIQILQKMDEKQKEEKKNGEIKKAAQ